MNKPDLVSANTTNAVHDLSKGDIDTIRAGSDITVTRKGRTVTLTDGEHVRTFRSATVERAKSMEGRLKNEPGYAEAWLGYGKIDLDRLLPL